MNSIDVLASIIREVDGNHTLGAGALAEAIHAHPRAQEAFADPRTIEVRALSALDRLEAQLCRTDPHAHIDLILIRRALVRLMLSPEAAAPDADPEPEPPPRDLTQPPDPGDPMLWPINDPRRIRFQGQLARQAHANGAAGPRFV